MKALQMCLSTDELQQGASARFGASTSQGICSAGADTQVASWLDGASSVKLSSLALNTAVVGEPVEVLVSVSNPLGLELSISRMKLSFEAEPASQSNAEEAPDASAAPGEAPLPASEDAPESIATASTLPCLSDSHVPQGCRDILKAILS